MRSSFLLPEAPVAREPGLTLTISFQCPVVARMFRAIYAWRILAVIVVVPSGAMKRRLINIMNPISESLTNEVVPP